MPVDTSDRMNPMNPLSPMMIFIDAFEHGDSFMCWCKERNDSGDWTDRFILQDFCPRIYMETFNSAFALKVIAGIGGVRARECRMKHLSKGAIDVFELEFDSMKAMRQKFGRIERVLCNVAKFYNTDIPHAEAFMFSSGLFPMCEVETMECNDTISSHDHNDCHTVLKCIDDILRYEYRLPELKIVRIGVGTDYAVFDSERMDFFAFRRAFEEMNPDIILIDGNQRKFLEMCRSAGVVLDRVCDCSSDLREHKDIAFHSYGILHYREAHVYLKGRLLLNSASFMTDDFNVYSIIEGARICRMGIQRTAGHSVGAAITNLLSYQAIVDGYLVPYKVGVYERIKNFGELIACDRGAFTVEPFTGVYRDVYELDFVSMFPAIISRYNMSPETLNCRCCIPEKIAGTNYHYCRKSRGIVPKVCDMLIDRRGYFKSKDDMLSKNKVNFLKWLLVVIFGFQAFKNKKIGCIEVHESINAVARETLLNAIHIAEREGFIVLHAIVDSLYIRRAGKTGNICKSGEAESTDGHSFVLPLGVPERLARMISAEVGLPIEFKKGYRFMAFLNSVNSSYMPVSTAYFGLGHDSEVKVRGIELRQRSVPSAVKSIQEEVIRGIEKHFGDCDTEELFLWSAELLRRYIDNLQFATKDELSIRTRIGKPDYKRSCPQQMIYRKLKARGVDISPGKSIRYIILDKRKGEYIPADDFNGRFDRDSYSELLIKAVLRVLVPFGLKRELLERMISEQKILADYDERIKEAVFASWDIISDMR